MPERDASIAAAQDAGLARPDDAAALRRRVDDTLERLDASLALRGELPVFSGATRRIGEAIRGSETDIPALSQAVLSDAALTNKVLRLANSAMYQALGGEITTASRALMVLGVDVVSNLAASLKVVESYSAAARSNEAARPVVARAMLAGSLAGRLAPGSDPVQNEEQIVTAVLHSFGQLLCAFYLPEDWAAIAAAGEGTGAGSAGDPSASAEGLAGGSAAGSGEGSADAATAIARAFRDQLGMTDVELASRLLERWSMPATLARLLGGARPASVAHWQATNPGREPSANERVGLVAELSNVVAEAIGRDADAQEIASLCEPFEKLLQITPAAVLREVAALKADPTLSGIVEETLGADLGGFGRRIKPQDAAARLDRELLGVATGEAEAGGLNRVLNQCMEAVYMSFGAQRAILYVLQPRREQYLARLLYGAIDPDHQYATFTSRFAPDIFHVAIATRRVVSVADTADPHQQRRLPDCVRRYFGDGAACTVVPVARGAVVPMLLYLDWPRPTVLNANDAAGLVRLAARIAAAIGLVRAPNAQPG